MLALIQTASSRLDKLFELTGFDSNAWMANAVRLSVQGWKIFRIFRWRLFVPDASLTPHVVGARANRERKK